MPSYQRVTVIIHDNNTFKDRNSIPRSRELIYLYYKRILAIFLNYEFKKGRGKLLEWERRNLKTCKYLPHNVIIIIWGNIKLNSEVKTYSKRNRC